MKDYFLNNYKKKQPSGGNEDKAASLEDLLENKVRSLRGILQAILQDLHQREALSQQVIHDLENHTSKIKSLLMDLSVWPRTIPSIEARRQSLERQLDILRTEKRREQVQAWQDGQALKREFRTWWKQYKDQTLRTRLLR